MKVPSTALNIQCSFEARDVVALNAYWRVGKEPTRSDYSGAMRGVFGETSFSIRSFADVTDGDDGELKSLYVRVLPIVDAQFSVLCNYQEGLLKILPSSEYTHHEELVPDGWLDFEVKIEKVCMLQYSSVTLSLLGEG